MPLLFSERPDLSPRRRVEAEGPKSAKIAIIGEAPGSKEVIAERPFVGPAGNLLGQLLQNAGIIRSDCYVTNLIKEQPPTTGRKTNDISTFIDVTRASGPIETDIYKEYREELRREIEDTDCNILIAMGNATLYALTDIYPPSITKRRGSIYKCSLVPNRKVLACIHPAACLYGGTGGGMYIWKHFIVHDLRRAKEESRDRIIRRNGFEYIIKPSYQECVNFLENIIEKDISPIAFDIEVVNLEVSCISFAHIVEGKKVSISIPFTANHTNYMNVEQERNIWNLIAMIIRSPSIVKVGQNLVFDIQFIFRKYGIAPPHIEGILEDTMIAQGVLVPDFPKGLDFITSIYTNEPYYKDEGKKHFAGVLDDDRSFWLYSAKDSAICMEAIEEQKAELRQIGNMDRYRRQTDLIPILVYMSERGIRMDVDGMREKSREVGNRLGELQEELNVLCGEEVNPNSPKQLAEYFYQKKGMPPHKKGGRTTTDVDALKRLAGKGMEEASILLEMRKLGKLKGTYLDATLDEDNRLRTSFNPVGAADSGRLSSSKTIWDTGMNIQNSPSSFKKYMLFDEGYAGYDMDLGQAENRIVAYIAPEPNMIDAFESGEDIHKKTAALMFNKDISEVTEKLGTCPICSNPATCGHKGDRFWGKKSNHSFNYGLGPYQFAYKLEIENKLGKAIRAAYHAAYPGLQRYWQWVQEELRRGRILVNPFGTHRLFMDRWGDSLFKEAYSFIPQSTVADKINEHGLKHIYYNQGTYPEVELLNQVHDSIVFQIPLTVPWKRHAEILLSIRESLQRPMVWRLREFTIPADLSMGKNMEDVRGIEWLNNAEQLGQRLQDTWAEVSMEVSRGE